VDTSNLIVPASDQQVPAQVCPDVTVGEIESVAAALCGMADPRKARGVRHGAFGLLMAVMVAVLAGARTTIEIAEHVQELSARQRQQAGLRWRTAPSLSTIRRFLLVLEQAVLQEALNAWAQAHAARIAATENGLRHFAVDGKSQRGAACKGRPKPHLLGVLDVGAGLFVGQLPIAAKTNEIGMFTDVLDQISDLTGVLISADAMHTQTAHADYLHERGAGLLVGVKGNQPTLFEQVKALPWEKIPVGDTQVGARLHHRTEKRVVKVASIGRRDEQIAFAHARQVAQVTRYEKRKTRTEGRWHWKKLETAYYLATLDQVRLPPARLAQAVREHWAIESWHWLRDVTFGEDHHRARSGNIAANLAALRNTAISLLHLTGTTQIARNLRRLARNPDHAITLLTSAYPTMN
jgi:predicted transposase YbfD/YdcC